MSVIPLPDGEHSLTLLYSIVPLPVRLGAKERDFRVVLPGGEEGLGPCTFAGATFTLPAYPYNETIVHAWWLTPASLPWCYLFITILSPVIVVPDVGSAPLSLVLTSSTCSGTCPVAGSMATFLNTWPS